MRGPLRAKQAQNGGRVWEFLADCPEVPADPTANPPHAARRDELRDHNNDRATPFSLRRNGWEIGNPEHWQVQHLIAAVDPYTPRSETATAPLATGLLQPIQIRTEGTTVHGWEFLRAPGEWHRRRPEPVPVIKAGWLMWRKTSTGFTSHLRAGRAARSTSTS